VREKIVDVMTNKPSTGTMQKAEQWVSNVYI
jgi:hypothetical protein